MRFYRLCFVFVAMLFLSGCTVIAVGGAAVATGAVVLDTRSVGTQVEDSGMRLRLRALIDENESLNAQRIRIIPYNGDVLLIGQVANDTMKREAEQIVRASGEALNVFNQLKVESIASLGDRSKDTWITTKVKSLLLRDPDFDTAGIKVVTENHEVYLLGIVDNATAAHAIEVARNVRGVERVVDVLYRDGQEPT
ncbi:MAG: lipoprotein [Idiomarinaceae bacterium HL-53]|nr:MAG: lipoprotein [Idiomarinaceae bacterium HL-53]CUS47408.1 Osmotically-inducible protein OsmY, contains BON domain [Idiomarinaceae bacterium HL-53]